MIMVCAARYNHEVKELTLTSEQVAWCDAVLPDEAPAARPWKFEGLRAEASHRQFFRIQPNSNQQASLVLMASPPELERNAQFMALADVFSRQGIPVPSIYAHNHRLGLYLMTDLGTTDLEAAYASPSRHQAVQSAVQLLWRLQPIQDRAVEPYTRDRFEMELGIFNEWFVENFLEQAENRSAYAPSYGLLLEAIEMQPIGCVHRDYHCRNLLFNEGQLGVVDFQDALAGPLLYDLASLLRDCYYTFKEDEVDDWIDHYLSHDGPLMAPLRTQPRNEIRRQFDWTAIQRQLKAIGIFARLHLRDGKSSHLPYILPLLERLLALLAQYSELTDLRLQLSHCTALCRQQMDGHPA